MKYLSITQTTERWGISTRRIQILCGEGRVPGAIRIGNEKFSKKFAPLLLRKRERVVSADMRFERVASTSGVRTHRKMSGSALQPIRPF